MPDARRPAFSIALAPLRFPLLSALVIEKALQEKQEKPIFFLFFQDSSARPCERSHCKADFPVRGLAMVSEYGIIPVPERKNKDAALSPIIQRTKGRVGMSAARCAVRSHRRHRSASPLIALIAEVLYASFSYRMSEECVALLERDADLLAAMQWLVLHALSH